MARMYTLDNKLLTDVPEIRVGEKCYPVDNRYKTVKKLIKEFKDTNDDTSVEEIEKLFALAFGKKVKELDLENMSFEAVTKLQELVIAAMTGEEISAEKVNDGSNS